VRIPYKSHEVRAHSHTLHDRKVRSGIRVEHIDQQQRAVRWLCGRSDHRASGHSQTQPQALMTDSQSSECDNVFAFILAL